MSFNAIGLRKPLYSVSAGLNDYLRKHGRLAASPVSYDDLKRYDGLMPQLGADGRETLWNTVLFRPQELHELHERLVEAYQLLIADGRHIDHLQVAGVDLCPYGNSQPFRVKIHNKLNDNHDYYYIKRTDASRVYGLELEHLLSPNRINYVMDGVTLLEEHIIGVPGDTFIKDPSRYGGGMNAVRLCKEFIKFNERCFVRLLGDMRAYNFVVDVIHDLDQVQYRIRTIDLDQQCHEGRLRIYLPQFYKENLPYVELAAKVIGAESVDQYRNEERSLLRRRLKLAKDTLAELLAAMHHDELAPEANVRQLAAELADHHSDEAFLACRSMGALLALHLRACLGGDDVRLPVSAT
ncbi:MAG: hypothetical protein IPL52_03675 [Flavobacteriales bacterium]|nr:hypothetical protein [Flavobacteriales bacterium]